MPTGWYGMLCDICFEGLLKEDCFIDAKGGRWTICIDGDCAEKAGFDKDGNDRLE